MIAYNPKQWFRLIFHAYSAQVFRKLFPALLAIGGYSAAVCYVELVVLESPINLANTVHSLLGFVLSLFLVFRTNTAYDRWWEGRKQWGALVNVSRTLAQRVRWVPDAAGQTPFRLGIPGFATTCEANPRRCRTTSRACRMLRMRGLRRWEGRLGFGAKIGPSRTTSTGSSKATSSA